MPHNDGSFQLQLADQCRNVLGLHVRRVIGSGWVGQAMPPRVGQHNVVVVGQILGKAGPAESVV